MTLLKVQLPDQGRFGMPNGILRGGPGVCQRKGRLPV